MKAVILAAGQGTRLRPLTDDRPKCLVEYRGRPLIDHILDALETCGVSPIVIVSGYRADVLQEHVDDRGVRLVRNADFASTNMVMSLFSAEHELDEDLIISYADIVYRPEIVRALMAEPSDLAITIDLDWRSLWTRRMEDPLTDAETLKLDEGGRVLDLGRKPESPDEIQGQYMGLIKMRRPALAAARTLFHGMDRTATYDGKPFREMYMTTFIRALIAAGLTCQSVPVRGGWLEVDTPSDLELSF